MPITAFYASLLAFLFVLLSARVITQRREARVEIGVGESWELLRRSRVHANFAEYVPMALLLLAFAESLKVPSIALHALGLALLVGRLVHAYALSQNPHILRLRVVGVTLTLTTIGLAAFLCFLFAGLNLIV
ncbi:MAPEG family protein [Hyphomicrobium sp.]|uniref:MAPEG family protein n=1 Tax=Hyphomicrobium sp. TaxID=82 RepID=UPI0025B9A6C6|nr:MAPEG family protein [Hyphomicrobium sp.]MCC7253480.1 MAPEG family protein [Hyphomicrobium sp.]